MLEGPHGAGFAPHHGGDVVHRQVAHHPEQDHLGLGRWKGRDPLERGTGSDGPHAVTLAVARQRVPRDHLRRGRRRAPTTRPPMEVGQTPVGDGEHPRSQARLGAPELGDALGHRDEHVRRQVLGVLSSSMAQEAEHARVQVAIDRLDRPGRSGLGGEEHLIEPIRKRHTIILPAGVPDSTTLSSENARIREK